MIAHGAALTIARVPLAALVVAEHQPRNLARVAHYVALLADPRHAASDPGLLTVAPIDGGRYVVQDGHHRFLALVIAGRADARCLIVRERAS